MKSTRTAITLGYNQRVEVVPGVWENELTLKKVRAEQQRIFERRATQAKLEGLVLTARFRIRGNYETADLDYVTWQGRDYKVASATPELESHHSIIELGELI